MFWGLLWYFDKYVFGFFVCDEYLYVMVVGGRWGNCNGGVICCDLNGLWGRKRVVIEFIKFFCGGVLFYYVFWNWVYVYGWERILDGIMM